jgi:GAF domain-containing protein/CheY-like chemotaxis protein/anti-sigma regulatory factor (Ser/Thr protein kinase)
MASGIEERPQDQRTRELEVLAEAGRLLTSTLDLGEVLDRLAGIARRRLAVDVVRIWLLDEGSDSLRLGAHQGVTRQDVPAKHRLSPKESLAGWVLTHREPLALVDMDLDSRLTNREWYRAEGLVSALCVPMMLDERSMGILACLSRTRREFTPADVALAQALTAPAVAALRNAALYTETLDRLDEIQAFQRVVSETLSAPTLETALRAVAREMRTLLRSDAAICSLVNPVTERLRTVTASGTRTAGIHGYSPTRGGGLAALVVREKRPFCSEEYLSDPRFTRTAEIEAWARDEGVVALVGAPVLDPSGEVIALLWAFNRSRTPFSPRLEATLVSLAQQAALAIGRARAFEEERRSAVRTAALLDIARACTSTLDLTAVLKEAARRSALALGADRCGIFLWRGGHLAPVMGQYADGHAEPDLWRRFKALSAQPIEDIPAHAEAIRERRPVTVAQGDLRLPAEWFERLGLGSTLIVPLVSNDEVVGTMGLDAGRATVWRQSQIDLAMTIAAQVALAVDSARHYEDARQRASEVEALSAIGETLASTLDAQKVLDAIADSVGALIGAQRVVVFELDDKAGCLRARAFRGLKVEPGMTLRLGQGAAGCAALSLEPAWSADLHADPLPGYQAAAAADEVPLARMIRDSVYRAVLGVPVISRNTALGAVSVCWDEPHRPDEREIRVLSALARQAAIALDNARLVGDLRRTLDDLRAAQETLVRGATLRAVGELAAGAAHHLNNLMAVVLGRTQLLLMKNPESSIAASLKSVERAAIDAADTVRRIQGFSGSAGNVEATRFDVNPVLQEAIEFTRGRWQNEARLRGGPIEVVAQPGPIPEVKGIRTEIREVIVNLLLNAVDALPAGGRIVVATRAESGMIAVSVSDAGEGMPEEVRRRAFEPFFTTKGVKRTGLGLAMAYGTIQRHGGQIALESEPGRGTTITFRLPAAVVEAGVSARPRDERTAAGSVLVIDDEATVRDLVAEALTSHGHRITVASGGREGLTRFEAGRYDVVLTDLGMPDLDGWAVARAIKATSAETPVLLLTGWAEALDSASAGLVDGILRKPFDIDDLAAAVNAAITHH